MNGPHTLPTLFLVAAEAALTAAGRDPGVPATLRDALGFVQPILTTENLIDRGSDLLAAAIDYGDARHHLDKQGDPTDADFVLRCRATDDGLRVGLVAGYLLARMLDGKDGAR